MLKDLESAFGKEMEDLENKTLEKVTLDEYSLILVEGRPLLFEIEGRLFPTVRGALEMGLQKRLVIVDKGAIRFVSNGADIMEITKESGRLMLFAGDQKVEHLNDDFFGPEVPEDDADPEHLFRIAAQSKIGVFATQLGLIARYGMDYKDIPYLVKVNSKTHLVETAQADPFSNLWYDIDQVAEFRENSGLNIHDGCRR